MNIKNLACVCFLVSCAVQAGEEKEKKSGVGSYFMKVSALFGGCYVAYKTYQYVWGENQIKADLRHVKGDTTLLKAGQKKLQEDQAKLFAKALQIEGGVGILQKKGEGIQLTVDGHTQKLEGIDKRTGEMNDHLLAIRKTQKEHTSQLEALEQKLKKLLEAGAMKSDIELCKTEITALVTKRADLLSKALDGVQTAAVKVADLQSMKADLEKNLTTIVATEQFITQCCTQLEDKIGKKVQDGIRAEFDRQRELAGLPTSNGTQPEKFLVKCQA